MTANKTTGNKQLLFLGIGLIPLSLVVLIGFGIYLASRSDFSGSSLTTESILFIDVRGRIALDQTLQVDGPAPVPVAAGAHTLTFFDAPAIQSPLEVSVEPYEFLYVPSPSISRTYRSDTTRGVVNVAAFPPDTTIEIPDCTPLDAKRPVVCKGSHSISAELSPGTYTVRYSNPNLGKYEETISVVADSIIEREYSYISTVSEWDEWRQSHGDVIERNYPRYYRRYGAGNAILLPLEVTGELFGELFD